MLKDRWFLIGLLIIVLSAGSAFAIGIAIMKARSSRQPGLASSPEPPVAATPRARSSPQAVPSPGAAPGARSTRGAPVPSPDDGGLSSTAGWKHLNAGRLREAQEEFLQVLLINPAHGDAMRGLVQVRRRLAGDNPVTLRRQAAAFQQAIARGSETQEHFTGPAMAVLAQANIIAAEEIEAERARARSPGAGASPGAPPPPAPPSPRVQTTAAPSPRAQVTPRVAASPTVRPTVERTAPPVAQPVPTPAPATPIPTPAPRATTVEQPIDSNEPFLVVRIGPVPDTGRVSEIVTELTVSGYSAGVSRRDDPLSFQVASEILAREVAERRAQVLAGYGFRSRLIPVAGGLAQLEFGVFQSADAAEALASRIRTRGYHAGVVREGGAGFLITAGPYRLTVANTIVRLIRSRFGPTLIVSVSAAP